MSIHLHWYLPTNGDNRDIVVGHKHAEPSAGMTRHRRLGSPVWNHDHIATRKIAIQHRRRPLRRRNDERRAVDQCAMSCAP